MLKIDDINKIVISRVTKDDIQFVYDREIGVILKKFKDDTIITTIDINTCKEYNELVHVPIETFMEELVLLSDVQVVFTDSDLLNDITGSKKLNFVKRLYEAGIVEELDIDIEKKVLISEINRLEEDIEKHRFEISLDNKAIEELKVKLESA